MDLVDCGVEFGCYIFAGCGCLCLLVVLLDGGVFVLCWLCWVYVNSVVICVLHVCIFVGDIWFSVLLMIWL